MLEAPAIIAIIIWSATAYAAWRYRHIAIERRNAWLDAEAEADHWRGVAKRIVRQRSEAARKGHNSRIHLAYSRDALINEKRARDLENRAPSLTLEA